MAQACRLPKGGRIDRTRPIGIRFNEQVVDGRCERCEAEVYRRDLDQWFFAITRYADELLDATERLDGWPDKVLTMQQNWIGRSEGARVRFALDDSARSTPPRAASPESRVPSPESIEVFTTRIDTIYGANFLILAPEHPLVQHWRRQPGAEQFAHDLDRFQSQDRTARLTAETISRNGWTGLEAVGFVDDAGRREPTMLPRLGTLDQLAEVVADHDVDHVFIALPLARYGELPRVYEQLNDLLIEVQLVPDRPNLAGMRFETVEIRHSTIHQHDVRHQPRGQRHRFEAAGGGDDADAGALEEARQDAAIDDVVICDERRQPRAGCEPCVDRQPLVAMC